MAITSPLHELSKRGGATFEERAGWSLPARFTDTTPEYEAARGHAALFDCSACSKIELAGPDAIGFLHNLCTNDIKNLPVGGGCEAFLTTHKAREDAHRFYERLGFKGSHLGMKLNLR